MSHRLSQLQSHLTSAKISSSAVTDKKDDDVVIVAAYRTAIAKGGRGSFKDIKSDELLYKFLVELLKKVDKLDPALIQDVACGNVLNKGAGATEFRAAAIGAGIPATTPFLAINRQCSSSLTAVNDIANKIKVGQIDIGLACGVESMTQHYGPGAIGELSPALKKIPESKTCEIPMGITNENIAERYSIDRRVQDEFAAKSYNKAEQAVSSGLFRDEILPIEVEIKQESEEDDEGETKITVKKVTVSTDEGPRKNVTAQSLSKIRTAFKKNGTTHAGNSSQVSDGASGAILAKRSVAKKLGLPIVGKYVDFRVVGVPPEIMGVGPAYAIPAVLSSTGLSVNDVAVYEINEAFAAQALFSVEKVGIDPAKVNPRGGAIALGHPLAATGTRQLATILRELKQGQIGVTSMCLGTGMGAAAVFVKE